MYGYESSATPTTDRLHYKSKTRPLVREGAPRVKQFSGKRKEKVKSDHGLQRDLDNQRQFQKMGRALFGNPGRGTSAFGSRYQRIGV
jgi:hypothetical protein